MARIQRIELPGGEVVLARVTGESGYGADDEDVGVLDAVAAKVEQLREVVTGVGAAVLDAAAAVRPDEASITFGIELAAKSGKALAVLADGEAKASVQVTLTWRLGEGGGAAPDSGDRAVSASGRASGRAGEANAALPGARTADGIAAAVSAPAVPPAASAEAAAPNPRAAALAAGPGGANRTAGSGSARAGFPPGAPAASGPHG
ncbi:CU044_2847 family protein [Streptomyces pathocidini]|uniref:CU044_2847 family protein n=1 Tax=Streptomyces pathocidini TaxID=1650571 RepID=A0ABW7UPU7_9ACTN